MKRLISIFTLATSTLLVSAQVPMMMDATQGQPIYNGQPVQQIEVQPVMMQDGTWQIDQMQAQNQMQYQMSSPASAAVSVVTREVYAPPTAKLNTLDSIALHTYCTLSKLFAGQAQREKCFVLNAASTIQQVPADVDLSGVNAAIQKNSQDIQDLYNRPTSGTSETVIRYVNGGTQGTRGPAGPAGVGISHTVPNANGSVTFYYTDGTSITTAVPQITQNNTYNTTNCPTTPDPFAVGCNYVYVPVGGGGGTGPQGPAGPQGPVGPQGPAGTGGTDITATSTIIVGTTTITNLIAQNATITNLFTENHYTQNFYAENATITDLYVTNATTTNLFAQFIDAVTAYIQNLFFDNATGTSITVINASTTNLTFENATGTTLTIQNLNVNNALTRTGNDLSSNVGGSIGTTTIIGTNVLGYSTSTGLFTSAVNGVSGSINLQNIIAGVATSTVASSMLKYYAESSGPPLFYPQATGYQAVAVGSAAIASGYESSAFGFNNNANATSSSALGYNNVAYGQDASAIGNGNTAFGIASSAFGRQNTTSASSSSAFGLMNLASGDYSFAAGASSTAASDYSSAVGYNSRAIGNNALAIGALSRTDGQRAIAAGYLNRANGTAALAIGSENIASSTSGRSMAIGIQNNSLGADSITIGIRNTSLSGGSIILGNFSTSTVADTVTIGNSIINTIANSVQIGVSDTAKIVIRDTIAGGWVGIGGATNTLGTPGEKLRVSGTAVAIAWNTDANADLAETFPVDDPELKGGHIVMFSGNSHTWHTGGEVETSGEYTMPGIMRATESKKAIGVVATNPGITLGSSLKNSLPVSFSGRIPVRVNTENGFIEKGDHITLSTTESGIGTKLVGSGQSVGIALSGIDSRGFVLMLVRNEYVNNVVPDSGAGVADSRGLCIDDLCLNKDLLRKLIDFLNAFSSISDFFGGNSNHVNTNNNSNSSNSNNSSDNNGGGVTNTDITNGSTQSGDQGGQNQNNDTPAATTENTDGEGAGQNGSGESGSNVGSNSVDNQNTATNSESPNTDTPAQP